MSEEKRAPAKVQAPNASMLDDKGTVKVYDLEAKEYRRVSPIDAREMVAIGTAEFREQEVTKAKPKPKAGGRTAAEKQGQDK